MLYAMRCDCCRAEVDIGCPISQHEHVIVPGIVHSGCPGMYRQIIKAPSLTFGREPFPQRGHEVAIPTEHHEERRFRDKNEARDWLGERGLVSKYIENDM